MVSKGAAELSPGSSGASVGRRPWRSRRTGQGRHGRGADAMVDLQWPEWSVASPPSRFGVGLARKLASQAAGRSPLAGGNEGGSGAPGAWGGVHRSAPRRHGSRGRWNLALSGRDRPDSHRGLRPSLHLESKPRGAGSCRLAGARAGHRRPCGSPVAAIGTPRRRTVRHDWAAHPRVLLRSR